MGPWPKGYLNVLVFNKDYVLVDLAYQQLDAAYYQSGPTKMPHQLLSRTVIIKEPGYVYIYLSNEGAVQQDIYFDDLSITHRKSPIVQSDEYYPFGLTFSSYQRENSVGNDWKFQGQEHSDELSLNWDQFKWRNHQPDIGRFFNVDPLAEKYVYNSPYAFSENKVTSHVELEGLEAHPLVYELKRDGQKVEKSLESLLNSISETVSNVATAVVDAVESVTHSTHGFVLTSEKGGVSGGSSEGVRKGMGDELEVGHLLNPSTRSDAMNLVKDVESEFSPIEKGITNDEMRVLDSGDNKSDKSNGTSTQPRSDGTESIIVPGNPAPQGTTSYKDVRLNDSTVLRRHWIHEGSNNYRRYKQDTLRIKNDDK